MILEIGTDDYILYIEQVTVTDLSVQSFFQCTVNCSGLCELMFSGIRNRTDLTSCKEVCDKMFSVPSISCCFSAKYFNFYYYRVGFTQSVNY